MLKLFLSLILALIVAGLLAVGILAFVIYRKVRGFASSIKGDAAKNTNGSQQKAGYHGYRNATPDGTIIDTRDPGTASRKIIPSDEGEYVDYTE